MSERSLVRRRLSLGLIPSRGFALGTGLRKIDEAVAMTIAAAAHAMMVVRVLLFMLNNSSLLCEIYYEISGAFYSKD